MTMLEKMWIIIKTANVQWAGTNADLQIDVTTNYRNANFKFLGLGASALGEGQVYELECDISEYRIDHRDVMPRRIRLTVTSHDAWPPEKFWILGKTDHGEYHLLGAVMDWTESGWFSTDLTEGQASYSLDHR